MSHLAVSAVGRDRPGIIAEISQVLLELGANIEDSRVSMTRGHFAALLIVAAPSGLGHDDLHSRLAPLKEKLGLEAVTVSAVGELHKGELDARPTHVVSVYGADHPGIVHAVSRALADRGITITDLETKLVEEPGSSIYVMLMDVQVPTEVDATELGFELERIGEEAGLEVGLAELDNAAL